MDDDAIFRMLYVPGAVDRRTEAEKARDRRKYEIASALRKEIASRVTRSGDDLWRFCLMATSVFVSGEDDIEQFFDRSKRALDPSTTLTGADVAAFLHAMFPHYYRARDRDDNGYD